MTADRETDARAWARAQVPTDDDADFASANGVHRSGALPGFDLGDDAARTARFRRFLDDLDGAKGHFRESQRHLLLGLGEIARVASQHLAELEAGNPTARMAGGTTALIHSVLELAAARIPALEPDADLRIEARLEALANLRALLKAEEERFADQGEHKLKRDTIHAIVDAITHEMERVAQQAPAPSAKTNKKRRTGKAEKINIRTANENVS